MPIEINVKAKLKGHFKLVAINADTGEERFLTEFDNLIVNQGLDFIGKGSPAAGANSIIYYGCVVGTGTTPPSPTDTSLQTFLAGTFTDIANTTNYTGASAWQVQCNATYQFATGVAAGTLSEIGICATAAGQTVTTVPTSSSPLFARALIQVGGSPGTITILSNEILNVTYTLTLNLIQTPLTGTFSLNTDGTITTVSYSILSALALSPAWAIPNAQPNIAANYTSSSAASCTGYPSGSTLGLPNGNPTGTPVSFGGSSTLSVAAYVVGNYFLSFTYTLPIAVVTTSNSFGAMVLLNSGSSERFPLQISFSPAIAKLNTQTMQIVINLGWSN